jgi:lysophospholipase L1-like esterase
MINLKISIFGDSICFGQCISPHKTWVTQISAKLGSLFGEENIELTNASVNGNTTRMALERMPYDVQSHNPDIVLIQFGINDSNHWKTDLGHPRVSKLGFKANLLEIIERARIFGAKEVLINTNNVLPKTPRFEHVPFCLSESVEEYNKIVREVALISKVTLIDIEKYFKRELDKGLKLSDVVLPDNVHLTTAGHNMYFKIIFPYIKKAVSKLVNPT